jgi:hypothetical protein
MDMHRRAWQQRQEQQRQFLQKHPKQLDRPSRSNPAPVLLLDTALKMGGAANRTGALHLNNTRSGLRGSWRQINPQQAVPLRRGSAGAGAGVGAGRAARPILASSGHKQQRQQKTSKELKRAWAWQPQLGQQLESSFPLLPTAATT